MANAEPKKRGPEPERLVIDPEKAGTALARMLSTKRPRAKGRARGKRSAKK